MKNSYKIAAVSITVAIAVLIGCQDKSTLTAPPPPSTGSVSFASYVTMGNSLTAGYQSGSLYQSAQVYSYGAQIANLVGASFQQPLMSDPGSGGRVEVSSLSPFALKVNSAQGAPVNLTYPAPYNNLGVPGSFVYDMVNAHSSADSYTKKYFNSANPLFDVVLRGAGSEFQLAKAQKPTILSCWIGNNDVLGYATSGGFTPLTSAANFTVFYNQLADSLASLKTKVLVGNIPSVTSIPYFTTVPPALKDPSSGAIITLYGQTTTGVRALIPGQDMLVLPASNVLLTASGTPSGVGLTPSNPIPNQYVLDKDEVANVTAAIASFNATIAAAAAAKGFILVDFNSFFNNIAKNGLVVDGLSLSTAFGTGGLFSLDGVHPTSAGYAVVANQYISAINKAYGSSIPSINVSTVPGSLILAKQVRMSPYGIPIIPPGALDNLLF